eukprot:gnl/MRDRNA2_/MRDRNA2_148506_c0_seq1.p1 gnl/MRDRNA2_/MRDRNA2_148506_c0~~gnl/MRDRNA2_/MRDRNA2_148506_c0_seq1.p1  ORF type:complete len:126 (-),score=40.17 gnl/MRDRNA2_/MRDRNA2_148506_c0_seq1:316-654(-)
MAPIGAVTARLGRVLRAFFQGRIKAAARIIVADVAVVVAEEAQQAAARAGPAAGTVRAAQVASSAAARAGVAAAIKGVAEVAAWVVVGQALRGTAGAVQAATATSRKGASQA